MESNLYSFCSQNILFPMLIKSVWTNRKIQKRKFPWSSTNNEYVLFHYHDFQRIFPIEEQIEPILPYCFMSAKSTIQLWYLIQKFPINIHEKLPFFSNPSFYSYIWIFNIRKANLMQLISKYHKMNSVFLPVHPVL